MQRIGFQGEPGAYSDEAAQSLFPDAETIGHLSFAETFDALVGGQVEAAVLPVENSVAGIVQEVSDLLWTHESVHVIGEHISPIRHHLMTGGSGPVIRALSHPQALAQSSRWLADHEVTPVPFYDTAGAAKEVGEARREGEGAIASAAAAGRYGLRIVASHIANDETNQTRFLVVTAEQVPHPEIEPDRPRKMILGFTAPHRPGSMAEVLHIFARNGANLTRLDSRPVPDQPFHYRFYADCELDNVRASNYLLKDLTRAGVAFRLFGSFDR